MNIETFSKLISEKWNTSPDIIKNYILANISIGLTRNNEMKKDINKLYLMDKLKYYNAVSNSNCINHVIMTKGSLEQEIYARKALGILLIAEVDANLRNTVISLLRKHNPLVFNAVKKCDKKFLIKKYTQLDEVTRRIEARLDAAVYFYFSMYRSADSVDQGFIKSIMEDIKNFEFYDPMSIDITKELEMNKSKIQEIKAVIKRDYGKINNFKDVLNSDNEHIEELGVILQNHFIINKFDINNLFYNSDFLNIDEIILSYLKLNYKSLDIDLIIQSLITGIFIKSLINEYKKAKSQYFENNQETLFFKIDSLEEDLSKLQNETKQLHINLDILEKEKSMFNETLESNINKLNKNHKLEINNLQNKIKELENQLLEEKEYRSELNALREYIFKVNNNYVPSICTEKLEDYISNMQILIIGGPREWRRKFREKYPDLKTLNGFNEKFEISILKNVDFIFFYTGFMNHATYTRAMNFIRLNKIKFGYIGKTNIELVEEEIIEEIKKYSE
ncbi:hypothetical protein CLHOM_29040 [Clostridium homopropionicum DSM 5847]|uniref:Uncharacterized protein n=1 Tax=Clostridium homopropionicum DSM 5847 TaxID=1121318 RepID=A0A0L6Z6N5_9CLOT|nr:hypothetical protein [Clostridium homopropionicum]KOA18620.1 hypothetical protein CLHOM_29040 [Clostridium homopropionicum DSM 5847]SFG50324.1 hypothetical protein SAMN04488501_11041 [Clostridium homopropionicum]